MNEENLVALTALLLKLGNLAAARPCSLARLSRQSGLPMSSLLRALAALEEMGLVERDADGGKASLSLEGRGLVDAIIASQDGMAVDEAPFTHK